MVCQGHCAVQRDLGEGPVIAGRPQTRVTALVTLPTANLAPFSPANHPQPGA